MGIDDVAAAFIVADQTPLFEGYTPTGALAGRPHGVHYEGDHAVDAIARHVPSIAEGPDAWCSDGTRHAGRLERALVRLGDTLRGTKEA